MKNPEKLPSEDQLLDHDTAEDLAYAQKHLIDIAHIAMQEMKKLEEGIDIRGGQVVTKVEDDPYSKDVPEALKAGLSLTTSEAATYLGVSRPHLVKNYLEKGKLGFYKVGRDRRIVFGDLVKFKEKLLHGEV